MARASSGVSLMFFVGLSLAMLAPGRSGSSSGNPSPGNSSPSPASTASSVQSLFERTYRASQSLQVSFFESYTENGRLVRSEAGTAYFRRPGKMRFDYAAPEKNVFLVDGKTAWFFAPSDHTATRVPARQSSDWKTPLALLAGEAKLSRICSQVDLSTTEKPSTPEDVVLRCLLKGSSKRGAQSSSQTAAAPALDSDATPVFLEIAPSSGQLVRVLVQDSGGVTVEFRFKNWEFNPRLLEAIFHFNPPVGTAIVNGELPSPIAAPSTP